MPTIKDLGQKVKNKYPGIYDHLSDEEVGKRVKAKYPGSYDKYKDIEPRKLPLWEQALFKASDIAEKGLGAGAKLIGIESGLEMLKPIAETTATSLSYLEGEKGKQAREKWATRPALGEASRIAEERGLPAGIKATGGLALETAARAAPFTAGGLGTTGLTGLPRGIIPAVKEIITKPSSLINLANSFVGRSAEIAFTNSVGEDLQKDVPTGQIFKDATMKGIWASMTSYLLGLGIEKFFKSFPQRAEKLEARALKISPKKLEKDIRWNNKTIAAKISEEGYKGTEQQIKNTASANKTKYGNQIDKKLKQSKEAILNVDVEKKFAETFKDDVGMALLSDAEKKAIQKELAKVPETMTLSEANAYKIAWANRVPERSWLKDATDQDTFRASLFKSISDAFRKEIERYEPAIKGLNEQWAIANDVWKLTSIKIARELPVGGLKEVIRHGPMATLAEISTLPVGTTRELTNRAQLYQKFFDYLKKGGREDLIADLLKLLKIEGLQ